MGHHRNLWFSPGLQHSGQESLDNWKGPQRNNCPSYSHLLFFHLARRGWLPCYCWCWGRIVRTYRPPAWGLWISRYLSCKPLQRLSLLWGILCRSVEIGCPMPPSQKMQHLWIALKIMIHKPLKHCYCYQNRYLFSWSSCQKFILHFLKSIIINNVYTAICLNTNGAFSIFLKTTNCV